MKTSILAVAVAWLAVVAPSAAAQADDAEARATLAGVRGFWLTVEEIDRAALLDSVGQLPYIRKDAEDKLRAAGIPFSTAPDFSTRPDVAQLHIGVGICGDSLVGYCHYSEVVVRQAVRLSRNPAIGLTTVTWAAPPLMHPASLFGASQEARIAVQYQVDRFISAYRAANPAR